MSFSLEFAKDGMEEGKFWRKEDEVDSGGFASGSRSKDRGLEAIGFGTRIGLFSPPSGEVSRVEVKTVLLPLTLAFARRRSGPEWLEARFPLILNKLVSTN